MDLVHEKALIEGILFLESAPLSLQRLSKISGLSRDVIQEVLGELQKHYGEDSHGLGLQENHEGFFLGVKEDLWGRLKDHYGRKNEERLSKAALETLSIIAYSQPLTKSEVENIRGVNSDGMIRLLLKRSLIKEVGKKDVPGRPLQYGTTKEFLALFKLKSIAELPKLDEVEQRRFELNG